MQCHLRLLTLIVRRHFSRLGRAKRPQGHIAQPWLAQTCNHSAGANNGWGWPIGDNPLTLIRMPKINLQCKVRIQGVSHIFVRGESDEKYQGRLCYARALIRVGENDKETNNYEVTKAGIDFSFYLTKEDFEDLKLRLKNFGEAIDLTNGTTLSKSNFVTIRVAINELLLRKIEYCGSAALELSSKGYEIFDNFIKKHEPFPMDGKAEILGINFYQARVFGDRELVDEVKRHNFFQAMNSIDWDKVLG